MSDALIRRGTIWRVDLPPPDGSEPGDLHPVLVLQINELNRSDIQTVIGAVVTTSLARADDLGNVVIVPGESGLPEESVVNVSQIVTFDKSMALERIGRLNENRMREVAEGVCRVLGLLG